MNFGSIIIDQNTAPGSLQIELLANQGKQIATFGVNGLARGSVLPDKENGRLVVSVGGIYRVEFIASMLSSANNLGINGHIAVNGFNTHIGWETAVFNALGAETTVCADHIALDARDRLTINVVADQNTIMTIDEAQFIATKM